MSNKILLKSHNDLQNMYRKVINLIEDKKEREIIHCLFQDVSDKLLDNTNDSYPIDEDPIQLADISEEDYHLRKLYGNHIDKEFEEYKWKGENNG